MMNEPFSMPFFRMAENLRLTLALGITSVRDASGADAGLRMAVDDGTLVGPRMQISVAMLSMTGGHADAWMPSGTIGVYGVEYPGMPSGLCDGVEGVTRKVREVIRAGRRDQDRLLRRVPLADRRPDAAELLRGGSRGDRADGGRSRATGVVALARPRGDRAGGPCGGPLDRARHVPDDQGR
jgi:hypothetical protein